MVDDDFLVTSDQIKAICKEYYNRIKNLESEKYDLEKQVESKEYEVSKMSIFFNLLILKTCF